MMRTRVTKHTAEGDAQMPLLETAVAAVGRLALAAAYQGPPLALGVPETQAPHSSARNGSVSRSALPAAPLYTTAALAWLSERRTLTRHNLDHDVKAAVLFKDVLVAGSVITGFTAIAGEGLIRRRHLGASSTTRAATYRRCLKLVSAINRIFVAGAVAATPFINFGLFNAYKPHPFRSLFKL